MFNTNSKKILVLFLSLAIIFFITDNLFSQTSGKKDVILGEQFSISLENSKDGGRWELSTYNSEYLELIEDRKNSLLKTTIIFYPVKEGTTEVRFNYVINKKINGETKYSINIGKEETEMLANSVESAILQSTSGDDSIKQKITLIKELISRTLYDEALKEITLLKKNFSSNLIPLDLLLLEGQALSKAKLPDYEKAIDLLRNYVESAHSANIFVKEVAEVHLKIAELHFLNKDYKKSEVAYIEVMSYYKDYPEIISKAHIGITDVYLKTKRVDKAILELEIALEMDLEDSILEEVLIRLARIYFECVGYKDYDKSYKYYCMLKALFPKSKYIKEINERIKYLEDNFINYGE